MRRHFNIAPLLLILFAFSVSGASAQRVDNDQFPFSIMAPEPGTRRAAPRAAPTRPLAAQPVRQTRKAGPRPVRRGSSTVSTIPTYRSPLTPLGTVQPMPTAPSMANPASPAVPVPGVTGVGGVPAIAPARPAGQGFQDRATNCVASGAAQGVGPGQLGTFTGNCVNR